MIFFFLFLLFIFGICVGSFLNVVIDRSARNESVLGRSYCEKCKKTLAFFDLIPLFSFFTLGAKCRYCRTPLSFYYPLVEGLTGVVFVFVGLYLGVGSVHGLNFILLFYYLITISCLIVIFISDLKYGLIPFSAVFTGSVAAIFFNLYTYTFVFLLVNLLSGTFGFLFFFLLYVLTKGRGMGFGDCVLAFYLGLLLGFPGVVLAFYLAFLTGAFVSLILVLAKKKKLKGGTVAFGPFLVSSALIVFFGGKSLIDFMQGFLRF